MITIKNYCMPETLDEAYSLLQSKRTATLIGGGAYLRLGRKNVDPAIDLKKCGLETITEQGGRIHIGACVSLGALEDSEVIRKHFKGLLQGALIDIVGVAFRRSVMTGATVHARYGFSDLNTALMALDTQVHFHRAPEMALSSFMASGLPKSMGRDIVTGISIADNCSAAVFKSVRLSRGDYALLNMAMAQVEGTWRIAVGARPGRAILAEKTMALINGTLGSWDFESASDTMANELAYGTNTRTTGAYRRHISRVLLKKCFQEVGLWETV